MLTIPDGTVLLSRMFANTSIWIPLGNPLPAWKPTISSVTQNSDGTYHLVGTKLNGMSEGATYGDDMQMSSNYPIVRLASSTGSIYYARTFNWSSTGVQTGAQVVSTEFSLPAGLPAGSYTLTVSASGIASSPFCVAPSISQHPVSHHARQGDTVSFSVVAGGISTLSYQWRRGTVNLSDTGDFSGTHTAVLTISPASAADVAANYNCVITNTCGSITSDVAALSLCAADFNNDSSVDFFDYLDFVDAFSSGAAQADFNADGSIDFFDYLDFVDAFSVGC